MTNERDLQRLKDEAERADIRQIAVSKLDRQVRWLKRAAIALSIMVLIGGPAMFRANHYNLVLSLNGITETFRLGEDGTVTYVGHLLGNQNTTRLIFSQQGNEMGEFVHLRRNSWGFWSVSGRTNWQVDSGGILTTEVNFAAPNYFDEQWADVPTWTSIAYYHNTNAIALIEIDHSLLPTHVTASLRQWGNHYILQLDNIGSFLVPEIEQMINDIVKDFVE
ncbi:MAG: hypothetical protein FWC76_00100 [Defluviitaleaceae bacterium]|nr:hypothetical protein [Defluviitaleaceae bacterium]